MAGYALAEDNLRLGRCVVADSVNPIALTRDAWVDVARRAGCASVEVEVRCSDPVEHKRRVEGRRAEDPSGRHPTWQNVLERGYEPWIRERIVVDTACKGVEWSVRELLSRLPPGWFDKTA